MTHRNGHNGPSNLLPQNLKNENQITYAHDLLEAFATDIPEAQQIFTGEEMVIINVTRDVLCWVLGHNNPAFSDNLAHLEKLLDELGYSMER